MSRISSLERYMELGKGTPEHAASLAKYKAALESIRVSVR